MRKLKLVLDSLAVDSFQTVAKADGARGTVQGRAATAFTCGQKPSYNNTLCGCTPLAEVA
jgi:hypothetical protein